VHALVILAAREGAEAVAAAADDGEVGLVLGVDVDAAAEDHARRRKLAADAAALPADEAAGRHAAEVVVDAVGFVAGFVVEDAGRLVVSLVGAFVGEEEVCGGLTRIRRWGRSWRG